MVSFCSTVQAAAAYHSFIIIIIKGDKQNISTTLLNIACPFTTLFA
jgi:hypothetical protein